MMQFALGRGAPRHRAAAWLSAALPALVALLALSRSASLGQPPASPPEELPRPIGPRVEDLNWCYIPVSPPKEIHEHDIVTIRVDELSRVTANGELDRRKRGSMDALLRDWVILDGLRWVKPSPQSNGDPRISGTLNQQLRAEADMEARESMAFNIAAEVVDIRPNKNLVLEAHKRIQVNNEVWEYSLTGECRPEQVSADGLVLSRSLVHLSVTKRDRGTVRDGYRLGWLSRLYDLFQVF